jgi:hypothetical protein
MELENGATDPSASTKSLSEQPPSASAEAEVLTKANVNESLPHIITPQPLHKSRMEGNDDLKENMRTLSDQHRMAPPSPSSPFVSWLMVSI